MDRKKVCPNDEKNVSPNPKARKRGCLRRNRRYKPGG